jgi:hypothetical protein
MVVSVAWEQLSIVLDTQMRTTSLLRSLESLVSRRDKAGQKIATPREILDRALRSKEREAALHSVLHHYLPESADQEGPADAPLPPSDPSPEHSPAPEEDKTPPAPEACSARQPAPAVAESGKATLATRR